MLIRILMDHSLFLLVLVFLVAALAVAIGKKKIAPRGFLSLFCVLGIAFALLTPSLYRQYLLSCLDSEEDSVAAWSFHQLEDENLRVGWFISVLNDNRESQYVRFYVAQILADRLRKLSFQKQQQILAQIDNQAALELPAPFARTNENQKESLIKWPASPRDMVTELLAKS